jgi:hypothetical protein
MVAPAVAEGGFAVAELAPEWRFAVFLSLGVLVGTAVTLISHCLFGRCLLRRRRNHPADGDLLPEDASDRKAR